METEPYYTPIEIANYFGVSQRQIITACRNGDIEAVKVGKFWRIGENSVIEYIKRHSIANKCKDNQLNTL